VAFAILERLKRFNERGYSGLLKAALRDEAEKRLRQLLRRQGLQID